MNIKLSQYEFVSCWTKDKEENLALWKMYTNNKGVRICMDDDFLITYDVTPKFKSFLSSAIQEVVRRFVIRIIFSNFAPFIF